MVRWYEYYRAASVSHAPWHGEGRAGRVGNHVYPTLRLPESLGDTIDKRGGAYAAGGRLIIRPCEHNNKEKISEADDSEKESATRLYTAGIESSNLLEPTSLFRV